MCLGSVEKGSLSWAALPVGVAPPATEYLIYTMRRAQRSHLSKEPSRAAGDNGLDP